MPGSQLSCRQTTGVRLARIEWYIAFQHMSIFCVQTDTNSRRPDGERLLDPGKASPDATLDTFDPTHARALLSHT